MRKSLACELKKKLLLSVGEVSFWYVSVLEGIPQRHQGYQTQHEAQIWACTSAELLSGAGRENLEMPRCVEMASFIRHDPPPHTVLTSRSPPVFCPWTMWTCESAPRSRKRMYSWVSFYYVLRGSLSLETRGTGSNFFMQLLWKETRTISNGNNKNIYKGKTTFMVQSV